MKPNDTSHGWIFDNATCNPVIAATAQMIYQKKACGCVIFYLGQGYALLPCLNHAQKVMEIIS